MCNEPNVTKYKNQLKFTNNIYKSIQIFNFFLDKNEIHFLLVLYYLLKQKGLQNE